MPFRNSKKKKTIKSLDRRISKFINTVEVKYTNKFQSLTALGAGDFVTSLGTMLRGNSSGQRIGNKIHMTSLEINYRLFLNLTGYLGTETSTPWSMTYATESCRVMVILNRKNNSVEGFPMSEVLVNAGNQESKLFSQYNYDFVDKGKNRVKYKILYDRTHYLNSNGLVQDIYVRKSIQLNHNVNFNSGNTGSAVDIIDNEIAIVFIPQTGNLDFGISSMLRFTDT